MTDQLDEDALLERFRGWLSQTRAELIDQEPLSPVIEPESEFGLLKLVEEFTALRHEVKLQTKGSRGLQEQAEALLPAVRQAVEQMRAVEPREAQAVWSAAKPLVEALADLDEALDRGRAQLDKARQSMSDENSDERAQALTQLHASQPWLVRRLSGSYHQAALELLRQARPAPSRLLFDALLEGYSLIQARLRRAMDVEQLRPIDALGRPVDPELMTVLEVVDDPSRPPAVVVQEVRRGYTWRGRILRYAEVRATRSALQNP